jgi:hypothetical protein
LAFLECEGCAPSPTLSHPPQGGLIRFGEDLRARFVVCREI